MRPASRTRDLQQLMLGRHDRRLGQINRLVARRSTYDAALPGQLVPALAARIQTNGDRLVRIIDQLA